MVIPLPHPGPFAVYDASAKRFLPCALFNTATDAREFVTLHLDSSLPNEIVRFGSGRYHELLKAV